MTGEAAVLSLIGLAKIATNLNGTARSRYRRRYGPASIRVVNGIRLLHLPKTSPAQTTTWGQEGYGLHQIGLAGAVGAT